MENEAKLGRTLYSRGKFNESEVHLRNAATQQERRLGTNHRETLLAWRILGAALVQQAKRSEVLRQEKFSEAEHLLQEVTESFEKTLGKDSQGTLNAKYWLGIALIEQRKYVEVEDVLRETIEGLKSKYGSDHGKVLSAQKWLGKALSRQGKNSEAEKVLQEGVEGHEKRYGRDHMYKKEIRAMLEEVILQLRTPASRLSSFFSEGAAKQDPYTDPEITEISSLLRHASPKWSRFPRTYTVLRVIGHLNLIDELLDAGFSDYCFPVTDRSLPTCLPPSIRTSFVRTQNLVLTKSLDLEKGEKGHHCHFGQGESAQLESLLVLGRGAFGQVDKVRSLTTWREYARKQILRNRVFRGRNSKDIRMFIGELQILKRLKHDHIVELVGSYTDPRYMSLIMSPVADMDLNKYLQQATTSRHDELRTFFGCLATALEYLHENRIRHKDIKPANILVDHGRVLFTDFGLSRDFTDAEGSTSMSMVNGLTPKYCAPEVAQHEPRNTMSDIWSLGVVFLEIIAVLKGMGIQTMYGFFRQPGAYQGFIRTKIDALPEVIVRMEGMGNPLDNRALGWTRRMLSIQQEPRPTASSLVTSITATDQVDDTAFCGICCVPDEDNFEDASDFGDLITPAFPIS